MRRSLLAVPALGAMVVTAALLPALGAQAASTPHHSLNIADITTNWNELVGGNGDVIAQSSPTLANLDGQLSVVVGDRNGNLWALHLHDGSADTGWPVKLGSNEPVDAPISAGRLSATAKTDTVFVGPGTAGVASVPYGYQAIKANGSVLWKNAAYDPTPGPKGVIAGLTLVPSSASSPDPISQVVAGIEGQTMHAYNAANGKEAWSFLTADSVLSTAGVAPIGPKGAEQIVVGGDSTYNPVPIGNPPFQYNQGGHVRIMNMDGTKRCELLPQPNETVDSSPAVGPFLPGGVEGIAVGTGAFFPGASAEGQLLIVSKSCKLLHSVTLGQNTIASPAIASLSENGTDQIIATTQPTGATGSSKLYVINGNGTIASGYPQTLPTKMVGNASPVVANLFGGTSEDIIVPTIGGLYVYDGPSGALIGQIPGSGGMAFQSTPLVAVDPISGDVTITAAGYEGTNRCQNGVPTCARAVIVNYSDVASNNVGPADGVWPEFHHDPSLSGYLGTSLTPTQELQYPTP